MPGDLVIRYAERRMIIMMVGPSGSGKTTFARVLRSRIEEQENYCTVLSSDMFNKGGNTKNAYAALIDLTEKLLAARAMGPIVIDATCLNPVHRKKFFNIAARYNCYVAGIVFNYTNGSCYRPINAPHTAMLRHLNDLKQNVMPTLLEEEFDILYEISSPDETRFSHLKVLCDIDPRPAKSSQTSVAK